MDIVELLRSEGDLVASAEIERLRQQVAALQGIEAIADEYGIDGFVEIESLRQQVAELRSALELSRKIINSRGDMRCVGNQHIRKRDLNVIDDALARTAKDE